jgi:hypothetical protein
LGQKALVGQLIGSNFLEIGIEGILEASVHKVCLSVVHETFLVKGGLKMLKCQRVVKDISY